MRAVIVANGQLKDDAQTAALIGVHDLVIAADGGGNHCRAMGIVPDVVIGDMDSIASGLLDDWSAAGITIIRHPQRKDCTDLELALNHALVQGADQVLIVGALGARWDMSLSNLMLLGSAAARGIAIKIVEGGEHITLLSGGQALTLEGDPGDLVSLIPLGQDAHGVVTQGLAYPLQQEPLRFASSRGVSNQMVGRTAHIHLQSGLLICIHSHGE
jgi:thiamine pyrophosphokinase